MLDFLLLLCGGVLVSCGGGLALNAAHKRDEDWDQVLGVALILVGIAVMCTAVVALLP